MDLPRKGSYIIRKVGVKILTQNDEKNKGSTELKNIHIICLSEELFYELCVEV